MPNVRIKKAPRTGEQDDYTLVYNDVMTSESKPKEGVKNTIKAVPRKEANIEVEKNETVVGDINQDGFLELMTFSGKKHSQGGTPANIPDGSFIFSDTSKLRITNPELLKYFGMGNSKKGYTPAQISKKYQINEFIDTLKSEDADDISKKTANEMLKNNTKKLAELAIVQESMKGFESGIPDFAANVMAGLQEQQPQMKDGGFYSEEDYGFLTPVYEWMVNNNIIYSPQEYSKVKDMTLEDRIAYEKQNKGIWRQGTGSTNTSNVNLTKPIPEYIKYKLITEPVSNTPVSTYKNDPNTPITKTTPPSPTKYPIMIEDVIINNEQEYQAFLKNKKKSEPVKGGNSSTGTSTINQTYNSKTTINPKRVYNLKEGGIVKFQKGGEFIKEDYYKDVTANEAGVKVKQDEEGRKHVYDSEGYAGYIQGDVFYQWQPATEYYIGVKKDSPSVFVDYAPPIITKEMQDKVKQSDVYKKNIDEFNKMVDTDVDFRKGVITEYRKLYPNDKTSEDQIISNLKKQQQIGVTHDLMYDTYYPNFKTNLEDDPNDIWDAPKDPVTGQPRSDLMNDIYSKSAKQFGIDYSGGKGVGQYEGRKEINNIQKSYIASQQYLYGEGKDKYKNYGFAPSPTGKDDEKSGYTRTSQADDWAGDTTSWQYNKYTAPETPPVDETPITNPPVADPDPFTVDKVESGEDFDKAKPLLDTWFAPDITNYVGAITDPINRYEPSQGKVNLVTPGYDLLDPTRQLAANQEQMARYQYMLENSVDPQIALSASLAASGEGFQNAANVLANTENANVGIVNQAYAQNAGIENSEIMANENARQKYIAEMATLNENTDKAKSLKKWRTISAYNQGWHNFNKDQMMEQVLFPQVHTDNITGLVRYSGNDRALDEYNTYNNLYSMGNSQNPIPSTDTLKSYYDDLIEKGFNSSFAEKLLLDQVSTKRKNTRSTEQDYAEAQGLLTQQFGGAFNINDYIGI